MNGPALYEETAGFSPWVYGVLILVAVVLVGVTTLRMRTVVTADAIEVRFGALYSKRIPLREIVQAEAVVYRPVRDYGGWGIRGLGNRRALTTRGNLGVLLARSDGSTILVGSEKPRQLLAALAHAGVETRDKLPPDIREF